MQSILVTMQDTFVQQVKGLLGVAPPQPSLGPSVLTDMGQDVLRQPSPTGDREALRAGPKSGSKRTRESSRSCIRSGDPFPSECRDGRSQDSCCRSLSSHDTPYRSHSRSPSPKRHWERSGSPGRHHSCSMAGSWRTSPPGCRGSCSRSPASFRWRRSPSPTRWPSPKRRSSASQTRRLSPHRRYSHAALTLPKNKFYHHGGTAHVTWLCDDSYRTLYALVYAALSHCPWYRSWPSSKGQRQTHFFILH